MSLLKAPAKPEINLDDLRAEIQRLREESELRAKYGCTTPEQLEVCREEEQRAVRRKEELAAQKAALPIERERRRKQNEQVARDALASGHIRVHVNEEYVPVRDDLIIPCHHCGQPNESATGYLVHVGELLRGEPNRYHLVGSFFSHVGGMTQGVPCLTDQAECGHCRQRSNILIQVVI